MATITARRANSGTPLRQRLVQCAWRDYATAKQFMRKHALVLGWIGFAALAAYVLPLRAVELAHQYGQAQMQCGAWRG